MGEKKKIIKAETQIRNIGREFKMAEELGSKNRGDGGVSQKLRQCFRTNSERERESQNEER